MSGVADGQVANEATFDSAYMFANGNTGTIGVVNLNNTSDVNSGVQIVNTQRKINEIADSDGTNGEGDPNRKVYSSVNYIANGDNRKVALGKLDAQLKITQDALDVAESDIAAHETRLDIIETGTSTFGGNKTFTNDVAITGTLGVTGQATVQNLTVQGDLQVNGTTTSVNSTNLNVTDRNITVNNGGNDASSEGAGVTVDRTGTDGSLIYKNASASKWAAGPVGSEVDLADISSSQNFTNKTIDGSLNTITNLPSGALPIIPVNKGGTGQITQTLGFNALAPTTTKGDLVVHDGTNNIRVPVGTNNQVLVADSAQASGVKWANGGTGSGGGSVNFIENGDSELGTSIWVPYNDRINNPAVDKRPIDGFGGVATVSQSITLGALRGTNAVLLSKPASDCQGQGFSTGNISIPLEFRGKPLRHYLAYLVQSGTFAAGNNGPAPSEGDLIVYWYDVTNGKLVESSNIKFFASSTTIVDDQTGNVQFDLNCTTVRMLLHIASQSTAAWNLTIDSAILTPQLISQGALMTNFFSVTAPTITGSGGGSYNPGAGSTYKCEVSLQGQEIIARYSISIGTGATEPTGAYVFGYPSGYTIDPSYALYEVIGTGDITNNLNANPAARLIAKTYIGGFLLNTTDAAVLSAGGGLMTNANHEVSVVIRYKVVGQSASVKISEPYDGRDLSFKAYKTGGNQNGSSGVSSFTSKTDSCNMFDLASGSATILSSGDYDFGFQLEWAAPQSVGFTIRVNGAVIDTYSSSATSLYQMGSILLKNLKINDAITISSATGSVLSLTSFIFWGSKRQNPQTLASGGKISFAVTHTSGQSIPAATHTVAICNVKEYDTHGRYNTSTGEFSFPRAGSVDLSSRFLTGNINGSISYYAEVVLRKNGTIFKIISGRFNPAAGISTYAYGEGSVKFYSLPTDVWTVAVYYSIASAIAASTEQNYIMASME